MGGRETSPMGPGKTEKGFQLHSKVHLKLSEFATARTLCTKYTAKNPFILYCIAYMKINKFYVQTGIPPLRYLTYMQILQNLEYKMFLDLSVSEKANSVCQPGLNFYIFLPTCAAVRHTHN